MGRRGCCGGAAPYTPMDAVKDAARGELRLVSPAILEERLAHCRVCPLMTRPKIPAVIPGHEKLAALGMRCRECGCFCTLKAELAASFCPRGHWPVFDMPASDSPIPDASVLPVPPDAEPSVPV